MFVSARRSQASDGVAIADQGTKVSAGMEGVPRRYGVYQLFARVRGGDEVLVWAYFGRSRPTTAQLAAANAQLRAARLR